MNAAEKRGWQTLVINERHSFYRLDLPDGRHFFVRNITTNKTGMTNSIIAARKDLFHQLAQSINLPLPDTLILDELNDGAFSFLKKHEMIVVKPTDQAHGSGVTVDIREKAELIAAVEHARTYSKRVILQQQISGDDYRLLFIDKRLAAAAIREPAFVVGDGVHCLEQLIQIENSSPRRSQGYEGTLTVINEADALTYLKDKIHTIPAEGERVRVMGTANIGRGGISVDVTDTIDSRLVDIGQQIVDYFDIGLCGIDIIYKKGEAPYIIEINTGPSLALHEHPYEGSSRNTPNAFLDWLEK